MTDSQKNMVRRLGAAVVVLSCALLLEKARAQDTSTSATTQSGAANVTTQVRSATVVYVSGNDLVVKMDDGTVKHAVVPDTTTVNVEGKELTVHDLQPGMTIRKTITTTSTPKNVQTVRTVQGKVWYVNPPHMLILSFPDGTNKEYKVPDGAKFDIDGQKQSIFHLRKGTMISATAIKDAPEVDVSSTSTLTGEAAPPPPPPPTPPPTEVILIEPSSPAPQEVAQTSLPKTGSCVPLIGLLGLISIAASLGLRALRS